MKTADVAPILKSIAPVLKQELGKQGLYAIGYDIKSSRNGKITITVKTCEFLPANFDKKAR